MGTDEDSVSVARALPLGSSAPVSSQRPSWKKSLTLNSSLGFPPRGQTCEPHPDTGEPVLLIFSNRPIHRSVFPGQPWKWWGKHLKQQTVTFHVCGFT